jgi:hypothetical protein
MDVNITDLKNRLLEQIPGTSACMCVTVKIIYDTHNIPYHEVKQTTPTFPFTISATVAALGNTEFILIIFLFVY